MTINESQPRFQSLLAPLMEQFVQMKQACGYRFHAGWAELARFDRYLSDEALAQCELPRSITRNWLAKRPHESASTQQHRIGTVRQFATFLCRLGHPAYVPDRSLSSKAGVGFAPRILTHAEIQQLLHVVDHLTPNAHGPLRHLVMPEVFRLLYGCGLRVRRRVKLT